ncbi:hypothetical protein SynRCC2555_01299 [Synechococcus sp. WH 8101]|nr:hypothetical protein SynRCC2555_01299 [Synechococcus sp. WH 8101]
MQRNEGWFSAHGELDAGIPKSLLDNGGGCSVGSHPWSPGRAVFRPPPAF